MALLRGNFGMFERYPLDTTKLSCLRETLIKVSQKIANPSRDRGQKNIGPKEGPNMERPFPSREDEVKALVAKAMKALEEAGVALGKASDVSSFDNQADAAHFGGLHMVCAGMNKALRRAWR